MQDNPYAPPQAALSQVRTESRPKKPIAVWLFQILAAPLGFTLVIGIVRAAIFGLESTTDWKVSLVAATWRLAALALLIAGLIGSQRRKLFGRIVGVLFISLLAIAAVANQVLSTYNSLANLSPSKGGAEATGEVFVILVVVGLFWWWLYSFSFSTRAKLYFQRSKNSS